MFRMPLPQFVSCNTSSFCFGLLSVFLDIQVSDLQVPCFRIFVLLTVEPNSFLRAEFSLDVPHLINKMYASEAVCLLLWNPLVSPKHGNLFVIPFSGDWSVVTECSNQAESSGFFFISFIFVCGHLFYVHQDFCPWACCLHLQGKRLSFYLQERGTLSELVRKC